MEPHAAQHPVERPAPLWFRVGIHSVLLAGGFLLINAVFDLTAALWMVCVYLLLEVGSAARRRWSHKSVT
jgi:hypothetical protein